MDINNNSNSNKSFFREWLEKLQQESWQLELLISGFALYGIWGARESLVNFNYFIYELLGNPQTALIFALLGAIVNVGWYIFFINLMIHVILRGLWIGAIGLRYVSNDIDYDSFDYSPIFDNYLRKSVGSYDDFIERLEKICSVLFAFTFLIFLFFCSIIFFAVFILLFVVSIAAIFGRSIVVQYGILLFMFFYVIGAFIVFVDFISTGMLKRIKDRRVSLVYFYMYRFYSMITLSFLYRPLLYNFIDERYTRGFFYASVPYILIFIVGTNLFAINNTPFFPSGEDLLNQGLLIDDMFYEDLRKERLNNGKGLSKSKMLTETQDIMLKEFYIKSDFQSVYFMMLQDDVFMFEDSRNELEPVYRKGISWKLFRSEHPKNKRISEIDSLEKLEIDSIYLEKKELRYEAWTAEIDSNSSGLDSVKSDMDERDNKVNAIKRENDLTRKAHHSQNYRKILEEMQSWVSVKFDEEEVELSCHYYYHPVGKGRGILCHYDISKFDRGQYEVDISRRYYYSKDSTYKTEYTFPIIKTY